MPSTHRTFPPAPPEFREEFERGGWERVEKLYGARTDVIRKWIAVTGAQCRRPKGGKSGGDAAVGGAVS